MAAPYDQMARLSALSPEELTSLRSEIRADFDTAYEADDIDLMTQAADALDLIKAEFDTRGIDETASEQVDPPSPEAPEQPPVDVDAEADLVTASGVPDFIKNKGDDESADATDGATPPEQSATTDLPGATPDGDGDADGDTSSDDPDKDKKNITASGATGDQTQKEGDVPEIPEDRQPVPTAPAVTITAGADLPGYSAGAAFTNEHAVSDAMSRKLDSLRGARGVDGDKVIIASIDSRGSISEERRLDSRDANSNSEKIRALVGRERIESADFQQAVVASGGYCAPLAVKYDIFGLGDADRPIRDSLAGFNAERGGIRFVAPPKLGDLAGAVGLWTSSVDSARVATVTNKALTSNVATLTTSSAHGFAVGQTVQVAIGDPSFDGTYLITSVPSSTTFTYNKTASNVTSAATSGTAGAVKPYQKVVCQPEQTAMVDAVTFQLEFGNLMGRAFPELVSRNNELGLVQFARFAELNLLSKINALSTQVTSGFTLGTARDFLEAIARAATAYRTRHRIKRTTPLRVMAPSWVLDAMREDLSWGLPGDHLDWADAQITAFLTERNVSVTWHMDDTNFAGAQTTGALNPWPATFQWQIFAEGTFLFLDGGTLDLGIVRDSQLVNTNDYRMFVETFEGVAKVGIEGITVTTTTHVAGSAAATRVTA